MRSVGRSYLVLAAAVEVAGAVVASLHVRTSAGRTQVIRIFFTVKSLTGPQTHHQGSSQTGKSDSHSLHTVDQ